MRAYIATIVAAAALAGALQAQDPAVRPVAATTTGTEASRDTAIVRLEAFLARYPESSLRAMALFQLGELLVRDADEAFAVGQRAAEGDTTARAGTLERPNYGPAIARYAELVERFPEFEQIDAAAYTLGTLYMQSQSYADAARMFELVTRHDDSRFQGEAYFRLGDAYFELASAAAGAQRRNLFAQAATAYEQATRENPRDGDIYFLSMYKLGWAHYNQATQATDAGYQRAVEVFGQLVDAYDQLSAQQQQRLGLREEAIDYMAVSFTQVGGAEAANRYFAGRGGDDVKLTVLRRVASNLRDQGDFPRAIEAYRVLLAEAPTDTSALGAQREIVDIYQNRMIEPAQAQAARLELVDRFAPGTPWAAANPAQADEAAIARESALRESGQYLLAAAQGANDRQRFAEAASIYERYVREFPRADSAQQVHTLYGEALFGQGEYLRAGAEYARAAYGYGPPAAGDTTSVAFNAGRNAIVAFDSALARGKTDRAVQDSLFGAVDRFVAAFPQTALARQALIQKGRRASETERWDAMASAFRQYVERYPADAYTPTAQRLIGDALYRGGSYTEAQTQWETAQQVARQSGRTALADSIALTRESAAASFADTLIRRGEFQRAAEEVYVAFADRNPGTAKAPEALRDAIATYLHADSVAAASGNTTASRQAKERAIDLTARLAREYPRYEHTLQFQGRATRLLAELGRHDESVAALRRLVTDNPQWRGRADAMVLIAVTLDTVLKRPRDAAAAYEAFATAYPNDPRAADAQYNAAIAYAEAGDTAAAAAAYGTFASRHSGTARADTAIARRITLLRTAGDTVAADAEFARLCQRPTAAVREACATRAAETNARQALSRGVDLFGPYQAVRFTITNASQLTQAGIRNATARKRQLLTSLTTQFTNAVQTGLPVAVAAGSYYAALAQWEYGNFLRDIQLPAGLNADERAAAEQGAATLAENEGFEPARKLWQALIAKAEQEPELRQNAEAARWVQRARDALAGNVPTTIPPPPTGALGGGGDDSENDNR